MDEIPVLDRHPATFFVLVLFTLVSLGLGIVANLVANRRNGFLKQYFLGNRSLGALAVALTATVMSGGTFMGVPSYIYTYGWSVGLWICAYMVAPITILGIMGKRIGQISRRTGAITLPDLYRERFGSPTLALSASFLIMLFLTVNLIPQFKAGAVIIKTVLPEGWVSAQAATAGGWDQGYLIGLLLFTITVVAYTTYGGFLAAIWTDVFQSIIMAVGVLILLPLALNASGGLENATRRGVEMAGPGFATLPGAGRAFLPITLAFSFFVMWPAMGMGQPSTLVRLMAFRNTRTLRYSILYLSIYNAIIYIPLIIIFVAARSILPGLVEARLTDEVMPRLCKTLADPYVAGIILAAPYGAVMSTVSAFLLLVASGLVRDIYQRFMRPDANDQQLARASYIATMLVGAVATLAALRPPEYLQLIIVFSSTGLASAFLIPALMACFWRRASAAGAIAAMATGVITTIVLYACGYVMGLQGIDPGIGPVPKSPAYGPYYLLGFDPCVWSLLASAVVGYLVSLFTNPPDPARISLLFDPQPDSAPAPATVALHPELA